MTLGRVNWLENLDVSYLVFPERKIAKSSDSYTEERPKGDHMLACALGLGLMFPALVKAESPHHEGSKANGAAAKQSHEGTLYKTGNQKRVVAILIRHILNHKQDLNLPEARRENQPRCEVGSISPPPYLTSARGLWASQTSPAKEPRFSCLLNVLKACPHHSLAGKLFPNICLP